MKTDYKNDVFSGKRKYRMINNPDGTVSFDDVTNYTQVGDTIGAEDLNAITNRLEESGDYVVEHGTNGGWTFRKWASGLIEGWGSYSGTVAVTIASTPYGGFRSNSISKAIPAGLFKSIINAIATKNAANGFKLMNMSVTTAQYQFYLASGSADTQAVSISIYVLGTWK